MALNGTGTETQITDRVTCVNPKGFKLASSDEWFNYSKFAVGIVAPEKHATVTVTVDRQGFVRSVESAAGTPGVAPTQNGAPGASSGQRERTITRLAVLKAAAEYSASKPQSASGDVLKIAASWERWVNRSDDPSDDLTDAF